MPFFDLRFSREPHHEITGKGKFYNMKAAGVLMASEHMELFLSVG
jgi:hypothetical protein